MLEQEIALKVRNFAVFFPQNHSIGEYSPCPWFDDENVKPVDGVADVVTDQPIQGVLL